MPVQALEVAAFLHLFDGLRERERAERRTARSTDLLATFSSSSGAFVRFA